MRIKNVTEYASNSWQRSRIKFLQEINSNLTFFDICPNTNKQQLIYLVFPSFLPIFQSQISNKTNSKIFSTAAKTFFNEISLKCFLCPKSWNALKTIIWHPKIRRNREDLSSSGEWSWDCFSRSLSSYFLLNSQNWIQSEKELFTIAFLSFLSPSVC